MISVLIEIIFDIIQNMSCARIRKDAICCKGVLGDC